MSLTGLSWDFNAWGYKYSLFSNDDLVPENLCSILRVPVIKPGIVLEGGSIHTNGCGVLVTTEECLLNKNRNPEMNRDEIEVVLARNLGVSKVIWLPFGLDGDETDGHVDNVCCFIGEKTVLMPWTEDPACPNWKRLTRNREELTRQGFKVETLPQPGVILNKGRPLTLSYVNFAFANGAIIMPSFGGDAEDTDVLAIRKVEELFPGRQVIQLPTLPIIRKGGNIHCITQQIPKLEGYTCATLP
jgi:agmatine deiminase